MLRTRNGQPSLWESVLPEICLRLPAELERVDAWLDDDRFFAPFVPYFSAADGPPVDPDGDVSAVDVPQAPLPARLRDAVYGGVRLDLVAAVLPHRHRRAGSRTRPR